jgi:uncharacterized protein YegL
VIVVDKAMSAEKQAVVAEAAGGHRIVKYTKLVRGIEDGLRVVKNSKHAKRLLVVTDASSTLGVAALADRLKAAKVTVSAIGLQALNEPALKAIASVGKGRHYRVDDSLALAKVIAGEAARPPENIERNIAVVFVLDRGHSMAGHRLESAKEQIRATLKRLRNDDAIAVVTFESEAAVSIPLLYAKDRDNIERKLSTIERGVGSQMFAGLKLAYDLVIDNKLDRQVIVISDGDGVARDGLVELTSDMRAAGIRVSSVGVDGADHHLLQSIADAGDGTYYTVLMPIALDL